ncbi:AzlD domain-containing protein [Rossellomorea oryzaecorticis]|jgi:branched-subunit amino acid transport protein|uniref:AzlD domain-containing protein n=1 Tax=Rossellomorea oryzaecorticis TaxID=1396505 RepID=A0ABW8VPP2_9BACI|nr:AzlD domain-containing protein [[Bacillus] enclensis]MBH9966457.1 AzlD domain-containing protein [[Bacillus] enclensis]OAT83105.1 branched-chain amino acid transporter [Bacillus sp. MKU004]QTC42048.1 AzlD domain-containing protein [Bacillus sp. V3]QWC24116.1 AzlD domain-containing protein [Bacillus haikouensis]
MNNAVIWMIIGMAVVTYIPRMLPFIVFKGKELPPFLQGVLKNVPFAVLGALIFPSILLIQEGNLLFGLVGTAAAFLLAFLGANVIVVVIGAISILSLYSVFLM